MIRFRQRFLVADNICALATASVNTRQPCSTRALEREEIEPLRKQWTSRGRRPRALGKPVFVGLLSPKLFLLAAALIMSSCSHTRYVPTPEVHQRDSLSKSVNILVNTTYVDRTHTEKLHRGSDPACSCAGTTSRSSACSCAGTTSRSSACSYDLPDRPKTTDWGLSLISSFRVDTLLVKDSIYVEKYTDVEVHDTITVTHCDSIPYPVEVPVEVPTPIPRFYHISAWFTILAIVLFIFYVFLRIYLHR